MCRCKLLLCVFLASISVYSVTSFNVDSFNYARYSGPDSSMFGFSIAIHKETNNGWLIVGAPEAQNSYQKRVYRGGTVYKCLTDRDEQCQEIPFDPKDDHYDKNGNQMDNKTEQWFGATVSSSGVDGGPVVACAPRYTWFPRRTRRDPVGTCYVSNGEFSHFNEYSPCRTYQWGYHRQGSCQAGFSAAINSVGDRLFIGSPGSWYWQGQVHQQSLETRPAVFATVERTEKDDDSYMGYSTIVGDFQGNGEQGIAVGMPRGNSLRGKVLLFSWNLTNFPHHFSSDQIGSYYGYALAASDVDGDGKVDLIIGAPMYTIQNNEDKYDVGRVYVVYHQSPKGQFVATYEIDGFKTKSRFGQALASLGDINQDGYGDFAVGAPYDGKDERGAVYIYHGSNKGVRKKYSQVIYAEDLVLGPASFRTFGFSLTGGLDLDGNEYPDMAVGAYLSSTAFFFRSRPVVIVEAAVKFLTENKQVDIKQSNYNLRKGGRAVKTQIDFCIRYHGKGVPRFIDLDLQYVLDSKKVSNPRMGFVENENMNKLNDTIRLFKDQDETCRRKEVFVLSDIRDKLTSLVAEVQYWLKDAENRSFHQLVRNPRSELKPILDLNSPPSRKDAIHIHKECGSDNVCIPNLSVSVTPNVDKYLLGSKEHLFLEVVVSNTGEDSYETTLEVKYPDNVYYVRTLDEIVESHVLCSTFENNTLKCEIGNPIPKDKIVRFKIVWQPTYKAGMLPTYDFMFKVNSTNPEDPRTISDNEKKISVGIWSNSRLEIRGKSHPGEIFFNSSWYTADISQQSINMPFANRLPENVIGPQVIHVYYLRNEGPATIEETEIFFVWPISTLNGDDFLYLLEPPHFSPQGNVKCGPIPANYRGFDVEVSQKSIWDRLNLNIESESKGVLSGKVESTVGGGKQEGKKAIDEAVASSGDSSSVQQQRQHISSSGTMITDSQGQVTHAQTTTTIGGQTVTTNQTHYQNASGVFLIGTGKMVNQGSQQGGKQQWQGGQQWQTGQQWQINQQQGLNGGQGSKVTIEKTYSGRPSSSQQNFNIDGSGQFQTGKSQFHYRCVKRVNGREEEIDCGPDFLKTVNNTWLLQQAGIRQSGNIQYQCFEEINGKWIPVSCGIQQTSNQQSGSGGLQAKVNIIHKCKEEINGVWREVPCGAGGTFPSLNGSEYQSQYGGTLQQVGNVKVTHECYQTINGVERKVDCGADFPGINGPYTYQQSNQVGGSQYQQVGAAGSHYQQAGIAGSQYQSGETSGSQYEQAGAAGSQYQRAGAAGTSQQGSSSYQYSQQAGGTGSQYSQQGAIGSQPQQAGTTGSQYHRAGAAGSQYSQQGGSSYQYSQQAGGTGSQYPQQSVTVSQSQEDRAGAAGTRYSQQGGSGYQYSQQSGGAGSQHSQQGATGSQYSQEASGSRYSQHAAAGSHYSQQAASGSKFSQGASGTQRGTAGNQYTQQTVSQQGASTTHHSQQGASVTQQGTTSGQYDDNSQYYDGSYEDTYEDENNNGKSITSYINPSNNDVVSEGSSRRDPKTYGKHDNTNSESGLTGIEQAALGKGGFYAGTLDLGEFGGGQQTTAGQSGGNLHAGANGGRQEWRQESHWSETRQVPQTYTNTVERDNVPTDRPSTRNRFYGRKKRQIDFHPAIAEVSGLIQCNSVRCVYMRCTVQNLESDKEVSIALRARVNGRVLRNVSSSEPLSFSSVMAARINKLPYIGTPAEQILHTHEIFSTVSKSEPEIKPDIIPVWVVVLSAVAGTIILLLLAFILYKVGFFKRNRPSSAPERQPLNRNGYHQGDEAL